jgi:hypothetical protein
MGKKDKGSTTVTRGYVGSAEPYQPQSPEKEIAKYLVNVARRFIADRASRADMDEAIRMWAQTGHKP